jgi:DNA-binding PadR family transcriptional regulator
MHTRYPDVREGTVSVRHGLLALLAEGPSYGYQLRTRLETRTGGTWPLNIGQVYTTLSRLERDGLVEATEADGQATYRITDAGRAAVADWFAGPVDRPAPTRDELAIKLALAIGSPTAEAGRVVQVQRSATRQRLAELSRLRAGADAAADADADLTSTLVLDALVFQAEAELRWLDHCEARLAGRDMPTARLPAGSQAVDRVTPD